MTMDINTTALVVIIMGKWNTTNNIGKENKWVMVDDEGKRQGARVFGSHVNVMGYLKQLPTDSFQFDIR